MKLSIVVPAIRTERWEKLYSSINLPFSWEIIFVSPYYPSLTKPNVKFIRDFGSPMRASCLGVSVAEGKYLVWAADDAIVFSETLIKAVKLLDESENGRKVVVTKYLEACETVHPDWYYQLNIAYPKSIFIPDTWRIFNTAVMHLEYYRYLGGWDCRFETTAVGHADLAARAQRDGCEVELIQEPLLDCGHMPGTSGDHGPIYFGHTENDEPLYKGIYGDSGCLHRTRIDLDNWRQAERIWRRRFSP